MINTEKENYQDINAKVIDGWINEVGNGEFPFHMKSMRKLKKETGVFT